MEIQRIKISEVERELVSGFIGEPYPKEIDFNWLMPVIQKISKLVIEEDWGNNYYKMMTRWKVISHCLTELKHDEIYDSVVQFITWYNKVNNEKSSTF